MQIPPIGPEASTRGGHAPVESTPWIDGRRQRLALLKRALSPSDGDAREIIWASLRRRWLAKRIGDDAAARAAHEIDTRLYQEWIGRFDTLSHGDRAAIRNHIAEVDFPVPLAVFVFDANSAMFAASTVEHLRGQLLARFDALLCFSSDCPVAAIASARRAAKDDTRFTFSSAPHFHDAAASPGAIMCCSPPAACCSASTRSICSSTAAKERSPCLVYADEDRLDPHGVRRHPYFKPSFSPELLRRTGYIGPCALLRGVDLDRARCCASERDLEPWRLHRGASANSLGRARSSTSLSFSTTMRVPQRPRRKPPDELAAGGGATVSQHHHPDQGQARSA